MNCKKWLMSCALVLALFLGYIDAVTATPVRWSFEDVWFEDATPLVGTFLFDSYTEEVSWWDIQTFSTLQFPGWRYSSDVVGATAELSWTPGGPHLIFTNGGSHDRFALLNADLLAYPDSTSGPVGIYATVERHMLGEDVWTSRFAPSGGCVVPTTTVPAPTSLLLLGTGFIGLGWFKFRRRKK